MEVVVIGGGAVGLSIATALVDRGAGVTVLERERCGSGASAGNAGWVTPSLAIPVPGPGVVGQSMRWLVDRSGPLWIRPAPSATLAHWTALFLRSCSRRAFAHGFDVLQRAGAEVGPAFDRLAERGVRFEQHVEPLLYPAFDRAELEELGKVEKLFSGPEAHVQVARCTGDELRVLDPAIGPHALGGLIAHGERRVRPERFVAGLREAFERHGGSVAEGTPVLSLDRRPGGWSARAEGQSFEAGAVVLANGVGARGLLAPLGVRLPVVPAKGYSRTFPSGAGAPTRAIYLEEAKVSVSPYDGAVRISGTLELGARDLSLSPRRLEAISAAARRAFPTWRMPAESRDWAGMRSLSPDGLPYLGAVPGHPGLHVATGHSTLGITLAPLGGEMLADLILEGRAHPLLSELAPGRAIGGRRR
jgi:D-amino-acid dehydrogenase